MNKSIVVAAAVIAAALFVVAAAPVAGGSVASKTINGCVIEPRTNCVGANLSERDVRDGVSRKSMSAHPDSCDEQSV